MGMGSGNAECQLMFEAGMMSTMIEKTERRRCTHLQAMNQHLCCTPDLHRISIPSHPLGDLTRLSSS